MAKPRDMSLTSGERFVAPTIEAIERADPMHVRRYLRAASMIRTGARVFDIGCGCGYGSQILYRAGLEVTGVDDSSETIEYASRVYIGPSFVASDAEQFLVDQPPSAVDAVVCFDALEHMPQPEAVIAAVHNALCDGGWLFLSVPTPETEKHIRPNHFHDRHYTADDLIGLAYQRFTVYHFEHQPRHLGTGKYHRDCGLFGAFKKRKGSP